MPKTIEKIDILAQYLSCKADELEQATYDDSVYEYGREEYMILTDAEADDKAKEYILDSLWSFNADFIIAHSDLPREAEAMVKAWQSEKCESANDTIKALIKDEDDFIADAISADGRGHFLATYDGHENTQELDGETFYIYRTN